MSFSRCAIIHPTWGAPSTEAFTAAEIPPADFLRRLRSSSPLPAATPTALPSPNELMNPRTTQFQKRGRSLFVFAYVIHRLLLPTTLSFNLEFWIAHGSHIEPSTNRICLLFGSSGVFYVVHVGWATKHRWSIVYLLNWSYNLPAIISFGSIHSFATISLDFCMHPLGLTKSNYFFIMHVRYCAQPPWTCREKEKTVACEYNVMQTPLHGGRSAPLLHFQIVFQRKITVQMEIQKEPTTPVYHLRCLL